MKTRKTIFHRAVCMFLTAVMAVTLFTVERPVVPLMPIGSPA